MALPETLWLTYHFFDWDSVEGTCLFLRHSAKFLNIRQQNRVIWKDTLLPKEKDI